MKHKKVLFAVIGIVLISLGAVLYLQKLQNESTSSGFMAEVMSQSDADKVPLGSIESKIESYIKSRDPSIKKIKGLTVVYLNKIDNGMLVAVVFESKNKKYEGTFSTGEVTANQVKKVFFGAFGEVDGKAAFTHGESSGDAGKKGEPKKFYNLIGGTINSDKIESMNILFSNGMLVNLKRNTSNNAYYYAILGADKFVSLRSIEALDANGKVIYGFPPYPPEKR